MHSVRLRFLPCLVGVALLLLPSSATAQDWDQPWSDPQDRPPRLDLTASVGFLVPTDWSDLVLLGTISPAFGVLEQILVRDVQVEPDAELGAAVTYWRGRYGFRAQGGFSSSSLVVGGTSFEGIPSIANDELVSVDLDTWLYDVRGAVGLIEYAPDRWVWPYAFVGLGGVTYDLARRVSPPLLTFIERDRSRPDGSEDIIIVAEDSRQFVLAVDELGLETVLAFNFGVGTDFRIPLGPAGVGLRLELSDHVSRSPLRLRIRELGPFGGLVSDTRLDFGFVHHLRAAAGLVVQVGR